MQKLVYIAGPYTGPTHDARSYGVIGANIRAARVVAEWCATNNIYYFCPHLNSAHMETTLPDVPLEFWYAMDLCILNKCDALILLPNWRNSEGTSKERARAFQLDIPVWVWPNDQARILEWRDL